MVLSVKNIVKSLPPRVSRKLPKDFKIVEIPWQESRRLYRVYYGKNCSTSVLSFRYDKNYGEILVCPAVIRKEAKKQGNTYKYQFAWMILHGMLHLAGMHHEKLKKAAKRMEKLEEKVLGALFHKDKKQ